MGGADVIQIVAGKYDAAIDAAAARLQALGAPYFLRWFWEPDGTRPSKASLSHTPADYIKAWRYIHDRFAQGRRHQRGVGVVPGVARLLPAVGPDLH